MSFETRIVTDREQFRSLKEEWNTLLQKSPVNTIFLTWEWLYTWWEVFGGNSRLFIVTVRDRKGQLVGLAPLFIRRSRYYTLPVKEMNFIGTGHSDRQDILIAHGDRRVLGAIVSAIHEHGREWDIVQLDQIPEEGILACADIDGAYRVERESSSLCPFVPISGSWETYFKGLSRKFRKDIRNKMNNIGRLGPWEISVESVMEDAEKTIGLMRDIEAKSRKEHTGTSFLSKPANQDFLARFCSRAAGKGWVDFSALRIGEMPIAYLMGFIYNNSYSAYSTAYLESYSEVSPGKLVINEKIRWCFENIGIREFDFLRGDFYIKALWSSDGRQQFRMVFFHGSPYGRLMRFAVFRLRPLLKRILREKRGNGVSSRVDAGA